MFIPSLDAKDIHITNNYTDGTQAGYSLLNRDNEYNMRKFINTLDYSLDLIKLRDVYKRAYQRSDFTFISGKKEYTSHVINVTFKYSVKEYNRINSDTYVMYGYNINNLEFEDSVCIIDGELVGIKLYREVQSPASDTILGKYFYYYKEDGDLYGTYKAKNTIKTVKGVADLRYELYNNGFICDGVKYVRFKRSSGSARVGKCLFIDERLYSRMHTWEKCGLTIRKGQKIDLAAWESYISLTSSSIIGTVEIEPKNILMIDDYESVFRDDVVSTKSVDGRLVTKEENVEVRNSIWDGQSLLDKSLFAEYEDHGMLLLRNRFFKSCCFNANIQEWFKDNGITSVSQLNGITLAKNIEDVKLITTPNSIKFLKFGSFDMWIKNIESTFGVVKYEKPTHYMDGDLVQSHYQLLNTLQLSEDEVKELLQPSFDYITNLRNDTAVMRYHLKFNSDYDGLSTIANKNDVVFNSLLINDKIADTKIYSEFLRYTAKAFYKNLKKGHVLIHGNYSTMVGNPIEMLMSSIGKFDEKSVLGKGNISCSKFEYGIKILGSRSPHVAAGNNLLVKNVSLGVYEKYLNTTKQITVINSICENILQRLSGAD